MGSFIAYLFTLPVGLSNIVERNPIFSIATATSVLMMSTVFNYRCLLPSPYVSRCVPVLYKLYQNYWDSICSKCIKNGGGKENYHFIWDTDPRLNTFNLIRDAEVLQRLFEDCKREGM